MIRSIDINGLRGIREGRLEDLSPLVILVGPNGCGKSSILDALMIGAHPRPQDGIREALIRREGLNQGPRWLLWKGGLEGPTRIVVGAKPDGPRTCTISLDFGSDQSNVFSGQLRDEGSRGKTDGAFRVTGGGGRNIQVSGGSMPLPGLSEVRFVDPHTPGLKIPLHQIWTRVAELGHRKNTIATFASLVPGIDGIEILTEGNVPVVHVTYPDRSVPMTLMGDGTCLLFQLSCELATSKGGLVLLEEPEVHMHPGAIRLCAQAIVAAVRNQVQIVLTTHSLELIDSLIAECSADDLKSVSLYQLRLQDGKMFSSRLPGAEIAFARGQIQDDLR